MLGRRPIRSRFEAAHPANLTPLIGHESQLLALRDRWKSATRRNGQVVLLSGEAGIKKSRLAQALDELLDEEHELVRFQCSSYHAQSALRPFIEQLEWATKIEPSDTPSEKLDKLQRLTGISGLPTAATVPLLGALLSIPDDGRYPIETMSPQQRKERTVNMLIDRLRFLSIRNPLLVIFEDIHWIDPTSLEIIQRIFDAVISERILLILTFRPEFKLPWSKKEHVSEMILERLNQQESELLAAGVLKTSILNETIIQQIVTKSDRVPLFIEEVTKIMHGSQSIADLTQAAISPMVPTTIRDTLAERLDQLDPTKEIAQFGATIKRSFSFNLLADIADVPVELVRTRLVQLVRSELVYQKGNPPEATYSFKHALVQNTTYESLLRSERRRLHSKIAEVLVCHFPNISMSQPEIVAHHYYEASLFIDNATSWLAARKFAIERSANMEAIAHLRRALGALGKIPDQNHLIQLELPIQLTLGIALTATEGFASPTVQTIYSRARALCDMAGEGPELFYALCGLDSFYTIRANLDAALELAQRMLELGRATQNPDLLMWEHVALGVTLLNLGELETARTNLKQGIDLYDPDKHEHHAFLFGQDAGIIGFCHLAWAAWLMADCEKASEHITSALALAEKLSHVFSHIYTLTFAAWLAQFKSDTAVCSRLTDAAISRATEQKFPLLLALALVVKGWTISADGDVAMDLETVHRGIALYESTNAELGMTTMLAMLAVATAQNGDLPSALTEAVKARELADRNGEHLFKAELHRMVAELSLASAEHLTNVDTAELNKQARREARIALEVTREQNTRTLLIRTALTNLRTASTPDERSDALRELAQVCNQFDANSSLQEVQHARRLVTQSQATC